LDATGGVETIYVIESGRLGTVTETASGNITGITPVGGSKFLEYQAEKLQGNFSQVQTVNPANGTTFYEQTLTWPINKMSSTKDLILKLTGYNRLAIIMKFNTGDYYLMGRTGAYMTSNTATTGTALGDKQGYTLTFTAQEKLHAQYIDSSIISAIITSA
jgi:hypothetical protein